MTAGHLGTARLDAWPGERDALVVERPKVRPKSASIDRARARDVRRFARLGLLERVAQALALGRRCRALSGLREPRSDG